ncbi:YeeE/YedE family protein [Bacteroidetes/Chlorobi group bacterium ChocPot_Mid]|nr:MAG: YeeE/YedE family protein [Bacteroidetes/Chlorobi group bacterium ChocPot_Mid]
MKTFFIIIFSSIAIFFAIFGIVTSQWYLTAIPIGFMFGFFLQKGDLCASSAMSEMIMFKDRSKIWGFWVAIVSTMISIAIIERLGLITLSPKPLFWLSYIIGGIIFGIGMVFAGGCISGVSYKGAAGNINSIMALMAVPIGIAMVEYGPLSVFSENLKQYLVNGTNGESISLSYITGIPFWILAIIFGISTIAYSLWKHKKNKFTFSIPLKRSWKPWVAGLLIGILGALAYLSSAETGRNYPLGITHGVLFTKMLFTEKPDNLILVKSKPKIETQAVATQANVKVIKKPTENKKKVSMWLVLVFTSLLFGSWVSAALSGQAKLLPKDPSQTLVALFGGLMIGVGAAMTGGCSIGNILSGWGLMSIGNFIFGIFVLLANWATTYFYLMGGKIGK